MKNLKINNIYQLVSIIIFLIGLLFTYLVAEIDDAPGFLFVGTAITTGCCLCLYGLGSLIDKFETNNKLLANIFEELKNKK
ncbi:MAG: hypothetical protein PHW32_01115 [Bacilli bacterium]|nr:hypothetical protein [Bacilli bacterium]MDD4282913.1 hypothetical protein [Bacilli bacterium]MDD4719109.1 hypothetical protein [Bacilli bacterium]